MERYSGDAATLTRCHGTGFPRSTWRPETARNGGDARRSAHNPEVAGSNPAPATNFRRSRPFSYQEEGLWRFRRVAKRVAATRFRGPRQRDGGDGVTWDETAWTWWTLPSAIAGCLAQKYRRRSGVRAGLARTRIHAGMSLGGTSTYRDRKQIRPVRWAAHIADFLTALHRQRFGGAEHRLARSACLRAHAVYRHWRRPHARGRGAATIARSGDSGLRRGGHWWMSAASPATPSSLAGRRWGTVCSSGRWRRVTQDAAEAYVRGRGVDCLTLAGGRAVAQTVVRRA